MSDRADESSGADFSTELRRFSRRPTLMERRC